MSYLVKTKTGWVYRKPELPLFETQMFTILLIEYPLDL
jgi:hypothetical protein